MVISYITPLDFNLPELRLVLIDWDATNARSMTKQEYYYSPLLVIALLDANQYFGSVVLLLRFKPALNKVFI